MSRRQELAFQFAVWALVTLAIALFTRPSLGSHLLHNTMEIHRAR